MISSQYLNAKEMRMDDVFAEDVRVLQGLRTDVSLVQDVRCLASTLT